MEIQADAVISEAPAITTTKYRWVIVGLLFSATTINYIDRQVLGLLAPMLQKTLNWSEKDYAEITMSFSLAYAIGFLIAGPLMDRVGVKKGYATAIFIWSMAAMSHALANGKLGFQMARAALGLGESGNFPAAIKTVAEWFPKRERALATGIFNAGTNIGAIITPLTIPYVATHFGWRYAFLCTGGLSLLWLAAWLLIYESPEKHNRVSKGELSHIRSDAAEISQAKVGWLEVLRHRQAWAFIAGKGLTDPVWWFYLFWLPKFLDKQFHVKFADLWAPIVVIYLIADIGSVYGGYLSGAIIKRGGTVNRGRKTAMLIAACLILPTMMAPRMESMWSAVLIVSLAAAAHQWWSANIFTVSGDLFPKRAVAAVVGFGGCAGALGGVGFQWIVGKILQANPGNYGPIFMYCATIYLVALAIIQLLVPKMEVATLRSSTV
jgi:ACS family hexuronate transporter-like MFS transporter